MLYPTPTSSGGDFHLFLLETPQIGPCISLAVRHSCTPLSSWYKRLAQGRKVMSWNPDRYPFFFICRIWFRRYGPLERTDLQRALSPLTGRRRRNYSFMLKQKKLTHYFGHIVTECDAIVGPRKKRHTICSHRAPRVIDSQVVRKADPPRETSIRLLTLTSLQIGSERVEACKGGEGGVHLRVPWHIEGIPRTLYSRARRVSTAERYPGTDVAIGPSSRSGWFEETISTCKPE